MWGRSNHFDIVGRTTAEEVPTLLREGCEDRIRRPGKRVACYCVLKGRRRWLVEASSQPSCMRLGLRPESISAISGPQQETTP